jgi:hypothetical protein
VRRQHLESTVTIARPIDVVWAFTADLFNAPRVYDMSLAARKVSPGPIGVGSVVDNRTVMLGFETHFRSTVIEWDPPHAFAASLSGPLLRSGHERVELEATSDGTRMVSTADLELTPAGILLWPLIGPLARRSLTRSDRKAKALLEASTSDAAVG